jgi:DNA modification methylase
MSRATLYQGDSLTVLKGLPDGAARCCVTSPPYWGLRDYGNAGQYGLEKTPDEYVGKMVEVFREVRRVLAADGTLWLNVGDSYAANRSYQVASTKGGAKHSTAQDALAGSIVPDGLKPKDLVGIPWRLAFALQADGWWLRSDIIWSKPNPMPESVTDRPTKAHEYVFLLAKAEKYYYDADAIAEESVGTWNSARSSLAANGVKNVALYKSGQRRTAGADTHHEDVDRTGRNARTVWNIATLPYAGAHFATFPPELARRCILAGSAPTDTVLDPFGGSGTVASVATGHGRSAIHIDLSYHDLAVERIGPLVCDLVAA